jgi:hypothetical protein
MRFDDRTANREPEPQTARLGGAEGLEKAIDSRRGQSGTRILYCNEHSVRFGLPDADQATRALHH